MVFLEPQIAASGAIGQLFEGIKAIGPAEIESDQYCGTIRIGDDPAILALERVGIKCPFATIKIEGSWAARDQLRLFLLGHRMDSRHLGPQSRLIDGYIFRPNCISGLGLCQALFNGLKPEAGSQGGEAADPKGLDDHIGIDQKDVAGLHWAWL